MIRFNTRDTKPKLYGLLILAAVTALVIGILLLIDVQRNAVFACAIMTAGCFLAVIMLVRAFFEQIRYNPYSYNTIYYAGFALFVLSIAVTHLILTVRMLKWPDLYGVMYIPYALHQSAKNYMLISAPFILVFSCALCISNISLIRHEGRRLVNILGIILSFLMVGGEVFLYRFDYYASGSQTEIMIHDLFANTFAAVYLYYECMLIGAIIANMIAAKYEPERDKDFLIILGCGLRKDGTPTPLLKGRVDRALAFYRKQKEETGKELIFIPSGGQGPNEVIPESTSMKNYLLEQGIPEGQIRKEDRSSDTAENMKFSKEIIDKINPDGKVAYATTNYHVFRSGLHARRAKMRAVGMGAKTRWYFWPNASVREFVGLCTGHKVKQAVIFGSMIVFYVIMTFLIYR